jgi:hypothetical protein
MTFCRFRSTSLQLRLILRPRCHAVASIDRSIKPSDIGGRGILGRRWRHHTGGYEGRQTSGSKGLASLVQKNLLRSD